MLNMHTLAVWKQHQNHTCSLPHPPICPPNTTQPNPPMPAVFVSLPEHERRAWVLEKRGRSSFLQDKARLQRLFEMIILSRVLAVCLWWQAAK